MFLFWVMSEVRI